jgi:hypothetical protein
MPYPPIRSRTGALFHRQLKAALDWLEGQGGGGGPGVMNVPWHAQAGGTMALTNSPLAARIALNQPTRMIKLVPLDGHTQVRLTGVQVTTSASANTPVLRLRYKTGAYSTVIGNYLQLGTTEVEFTLTGTGARDTGWIDLVAGATGDIQVALIELGGDGVADPAMGHVHAFFR